MSLNFLAKIQIWFKLRRIKKRAVKATLKSIRWSVNSLAAD